MRASDFTIREGLSGINKGPDQSNRLWSQQKGTSTALIKERCGTDLHRVKTRHKIRGLGCTERGETGWQWRTMERIWFEIDSCGNRANLADTANEQFCESTTWKHPGVKGNQRIAFIRLLHKQVFADGWCGRQQPTVDGARATTGLVVLSCIRKWTGDGSPLAALLRDLCFCSTLQVLALSSCPYFPWWWAVLFSTITLALF